MCFCFYGARTAAGAKIPWRKMGLERRRRERERERRAALIQNGFLLFSPRFILRPPNPLKVAAADCGLSREIFNADPINFTPKKQVHEIFTKTLPAEMKLIWRKNNGRLKNTRRNYQNKYLCGQNFNYQFIFILLLVKNIDSRPAE
jgi:hypothetical protein